MTKYVLFSVVSGCLLGCLTIMLDFSFSDWQFYAIIFGGCLLLNILYLICKDDKNERETK